LLAARRTEAIHRVDRADPSSALVATPKAVQIRGRRQGRSAAAVDTKAMVRNSLLAETVVDAAESGRPRRLLDAALAGLGAVFAAALFLGLFDHGLPPKPSQAEAAPVAAVSSAPRLYFHGAGGEILDFAPAGQRRP
jgi:hypothetical protein